MSDLLRSLILVSEKAANIARICRRNEHLFAMLIEEKRDDGNPRFFQDFKTLADVLIQESIRHDISIKYPELKSSIKGEENNTFTNSNGEFITVSILECEEKTKALLTKVCGGDNICAGILAEEVHRSIIIEDVQNLTDTNFPHWDMQNFTDWAIWIDPIDSTLEYIKGVASDSELHGVPAKGLSCVTVLIGVYNKTNGVPVVGIINQPFHTIHSKGYKSRIYWGTAYESVYYTCAIPASVPHNSLTVALSSSEDPEIINKLVKHGVHVVTLAGAGFKILNVILGNCDCFVLSKGSTYKWDTCGPHAILKSMGGAIIEFSKTIGHIKHHNISNCELIYHSETKNMNGLIAYNNPEKLNILLNILIDY